MKSIHRCDINRPKFRHGHKYNRNSDDAYTYRTIPKQHLKLSS